MEKSKNISLTQWVIFSILFLMIVGIGVYYNLRIIDQNNRINFVQQDVNSKIQTFSKDILGGLQTLTNSIDDRLMVIQDNITAETNTLKDELSISEQRHRTEIMAINSLINQIERQSNIKLDELKGELKNIKVKSNDFTELIDTVVRSVVSVNTDKGKGSGTIISDEGFIVTNYHVIEDSKKVEVLTYDRRVYRGNIIGYNETVDIAIIKVNAVLENLQFANSDKVKIGERVIAIGNPAGLSFTVTEGIISATHRKGPTNQPIYFQTDVALNPGNSGGPLVNTEGKIVGINNLKLKGFEGLGFALESNIVKEVTEQLIASYNS